MSNNKRRRVMGKSSSLDSYFCFERFLREILLDVDRIWYRTQGRTNFLFNKFLSTLPKNHNFFLNINHGFSVKYSFS